MRKTLSVSGALGVRGTAFDLYVGPDGVTAVTLLNGAAEFCTPQTCQRLTRRCDFLLARPDGSITRPKGVVRDLGIGRRADDVFPFLTGKSGLPRGFKSNSSCAGLSANPSGSIGGNTRQERSMDFSPPRSDNRPRGKGRNEDNESYDDGPESNYGGD